MSESDIRIFDKIERGCAVGWGGEVELGEGWGWCAYPVDIFRELSGPLWWKPQVLDFSVLS